MVLVSPGGHPASRNFTAQPRNLPSLTGLRWVAAFLVFAFHVRNVGYFSGSAQTLMTSIVGAGATGVSLFFILSGFVLTWSHGEGQSALSFWRHRVARIYPLHVVTLAMALALAATILPQIATPDPLAVLANLTLASSWNAAWWQAGNPVSWSLVCEAFFYLTFPLLLRRVRSMGAGALGAVTASAIALVFSAPALIALTHAPLSPYSSPIVRLPEFVLGIVIAQLIRRGIWRGPRIAPALVTTFLGYAAAIAWPHSIWAAAGFTVIGFILLIAALARTDCEGGRTLLATRAFVTLGTLSFPFYLVHLLIVQTIAGLWPLAAHSSLAAICEMSLALTCALGAAWLLHHLVEVPGRILILRR